MPPKCLAIGVPMPGTVLGSAYVRISVPSLFSGLLKDVGLGKPAGRGIMGSAYTESNQDESPETWVLVLDLSLGCLESQLSSGLWQLLEQIRRGRG